jgi:hypothetical protein
MERFGPQYCETPAIFGAFPIEPANAISSGVIVLWGIAALLLVIRRAPTAWFLYLACAFLIVNGVGSILWHGLRTRWSLTLDFLPAFFFVGLVAILWVRRVAPPWHAAGILLVLFGSQFIPPLARELGYDMPGIGWMITRLVVIPLCAVWLIALTVPYSKTAALTGAAALGFAFLALAMRSFDALACESLGFGSHFLWHIFLSTAAYLAMRVLVTLEPAAEIRPTLATSSA